MNLLVADCYCEKVINYNQLQILNRLDHNSFKSFFITELAIKYNVVHCWNVIINTCNDFWSRTGLWTRSWIWSGHWTTTRDRDTNKEQTRTDAKWVQQSVFFGGAPANLGLRRRIFWRFSHRWSVLPGRRLGIWLLLDSPQLWWGAFFAFLAKVSFTGSGSRLGGVRGTPSSNLIGLEVVNRVVLLQRGAPSFSLPFFFPAPFFSFSSLLFLALSLSFLRKAPSYKFVIRVFIISNIPFFPLG